MMMNSPLYGESRTAYMVGLHALAIEALARKATGVVDFQDSLIRLSFREARLLIRSGNASEINKVTERVKRQAMDVTAMPEFQPSIKHEPWVTELAQELGNLLAGLECSEHTPETAYVRLSQAQSLLSSQLVSHEGEHNAWD